MTATQPNYLSISRRSLDLEDYLDLARRHAGWIAGPIFAGLVLSTVTAFFLPNVYESRASMQITPRQISETLVPSTINQQLTDRIYQMQGAIQSRTRLSTIIQKLDLYREERAKGPIEDAIEEFKRNQRITITSVPGSNGKLASAFEISFFYPNRLKAQATVQELISQFNDENQHAQQTQQTIVKDMFTDEVGKAKIAVQKANDNLTKFRIANAGRLPDQSGQNIAALTSLQMQAGGVSEELNRLAQSRVQLETSLNSVRSQMDIARSLAQETGSPSSPVARQNEELGNLNRTIDAAELKLQENLQNYKETHPDVVAGRKSLEVLKSRRDHLLSEQEKQQQADSAQKDSQSRRLPPQAIAAMANYQEKIDSLTALLKNNDSDRAFRLKEQSKLSQEIEGYRARLSPSSVEAQMVDLLREQTTANEVYQAASRRQQLADQGGDLIQRRAGESLEVLDPPSLPVTPSKPNRWLIVGSGFGIAVIVGLALAGLQEAKDTSLKNLKDVRAYTNLPVLGSVPLLENTILVKRKRRIAFMGWAAAFILGIIAVCAAIFYYYTVTVNS